MPRITIFRKEIVDKNPWFRLSTTLIGTHLVDAFQLYKFKLDLLIQPISVLEFSKVVAAQLVNNDFSDINHMDHDPNMHQILLRDIIISTAQLLLMCL